VRVSLVYVWHVEAALQYGYYVDLQHRSCAAVVLHTTCSFLLSVFSWSRRGVDSVLHTHAVDRALFFTEPEGREGVSLAYRLKLVFCGLSRGAVGHLSPHHESV
jgi:hypothetical protein